MQKKTHEVAISHKEELLFHLTFFKKPYLRSTFLIRWHLNLRSRLFYCYSYFSTSVSIQIGAAFIKNFISKKVQIWYQLQLRLRKLNPWGFFGQMFWKEAAFEIMTMFYYPSKVIIFGINVKDLVDLFAKTIDLHQTSSSNKNNFDFCFKTTGKCSVISQ